MKLRIIEEGWKGYTGPLCGADFVNGVAEAATARQAAQIANIIQVQTEEGKNPSDSQNVIDIHTVQMQEGERLSERHDIPKLSENVKVYTREELSAIADKSGINGLRDIAGPLNVKSTSIVTLIDGILKAQGNYQPVPDVAGPIPTKSVNIEITK